MRESNFYNRYFLLFSIFCLEVFYSAIGRFSCNLDHLKEFICFTDKCSSKLPGNQFLIIVGAVFTLSSPIFGYFISSSVNLITKWFSWLAYSPYAPSRSCKKDTRLCCILNCISDYIRKCTAESDRKNIDAEHIVAELEKYKGTRDWFKRRLDAMYLSANIFTTLMITQITIVIFTYLEPFDFQFKFYWHVLILNIVGIIVFYLAAINSSHEYRKGIDYLRDNREKLLAKLHNKQNS